MELEEFFIMIRLSNFSRHLRPTQGLMS